MQGTTKKVAVPKAKQRATVKYGKVTSDKPVHILLKMRSESGQTIQAHADMIAKKGAAVLGKMGEAVGPATSELLNQQIQRGVKTYLFLTIREGWNGPYVTYRCSLRHIYDSLVAGKNTLVPTYYGWDTGNIKTWFEITSIERLTREQMNKLFVVSSGREIMSVVSSSATVYRVAVR